LGDANGRATVNPPCLTGGIQIDLGKVRKQSGGEGKRPDNSLPSGKEKATGKTQHCSIIVLGSKRRKRTEGLTYVALDDGRLTKKDGGGKSLRPRVWAH